MDKDLRIKIKIDSETAKLDTLNSKINSTSKGFNQADSMVSAFTSRLELIGGTIGGLYLVNKTIGDIGRTGFETNRTMQKLTNSLAASIAITSANVDSMGKQITLSEKYAMATNEAKDSLQDLNKVNLDTPHTLDQTVKIYDAMYIGMRKVGAQSKDIVDITKRLSIAVGDKVGFDAMLSAMDGLSTGTVEVASEMGRFLRSIGLSNEAIKNSTDVVQLFKDKLSDVKAIESFDTKLSNLTNSYNMLSKEIMKPAFNTIEDNLKPAAEILDSLTQNVPTITNVAGEIVKIGTSVAVTTLAIKGYTAAAKFATATNALLGGSYGAVNRSILLATATTRIFSTVLKATPFGLAAAAIYGISESFFEASNRADIFKKSLTEVSSELDIIRYKERLQEVNQELKKMDKNIAGYNDTQKLIYQGGYDIAYKEKQKLEKLIAEASPTNKGKTVYDFSQTEKEINDLVEKTLNPYGAKLDEINKKWQPNFEDMQKNGKDASGVYAAWIKEIADLDKEEADKKEKLLKASEKLFKEQEKTAEDTKKAYLETAQIGMGEYEKALLNIDQRLQEWKKSGVDANEILRVQTVLTAELNQQTLFDTQKEELGYYERKIQLQDDSLSKELELQGVSYTNRILEIENTTKSIDEKNKLIAKETELFNLTVQSMNLKYDTEFQDTMSGFYDDMIESQIELNSVVFDFGAGFDGVASKIGAVSKSIAAMSSLELTNKKETSKLDKKYIEQFNKYAGDVRKTKELEQQYTKDTANLNEQNIQAQIAGYGLMSGAMSQMFNEGSKEAAAFQMVESGLAIVAGVRAILTQGSGDPYSAFARMAAMTASVASLLSSANIAFGGTKTSTTYAVDGFSAAAENTGTGSILGDSKKQSESITNALSVLENFAEPEYALLASMNKYLANISNNIGGFTSLLFRQGGFAFGDGFTASSSSKQNVQIGDINKLHTAGMMLDPVVAMPAMLAKAFGGAEMFNNVMDVLSGKQLTNKILGGIFGKTSTSQALIDSGITFGKAYLKDAKEHIDGSAYQTIYTETTKKSWFSKSSSVSITSYFEALDSELERQFTLVLSDLYNTVLVGGSVLGLIPKDLENTLESFVVDIGKISLKGKTGEKIQEQLFNVFGKIADDLTKFSIKGLDDFQSVGEGLFETLTRVATGMEEADYYTSRLGNRFDDVIYTAIGNKQGDVGFEALLQSIQAVEVATYPANNNLYKIVENLDATAEELYSMYTNLDELRDRLIFLKQDSQALSNSMIYGAGSVSALDDGFKAYFENFLTENEQLTYKTQQLIKEFNNLGIALPTSKDGFKDLLSGIDKTSEAGQELYGRLIILSEEFASVADSTKDSIDTLTSSLEELSTNQFDTFISSIDNVGKSITSVKNTALSFLQGLNTSNNASLEDQLISYNKLRAQFAANFDSNGLIKAGVNENDVSGLYSQISSIATNIAGQDDYLKNSLITQFENDIYSFNASEDVIKVNIVDGLGSLYNLTNLQLSQLQTVAEDGKITIAELNSIGGLTQVQKDGILDFANNSSYFSKENTLNSVNEYMKKQLEVLQKNQAEESVGLSKKSFEYGDYLGLTEKKNIAETLGVSYETAQPLVEKLQALSFLDAKGSEDELKKIIAFNGTSYDVNVLSQIEKLNPYLGNNVLDSISNIKNTGLSNRNAQIDELSKKIEELDAALIPKEKEIMAKYTPSINSLKEQIAYLETLKFNQSGETQANISINQNGLRAKIKNLENTINNEFGTFANENRSKIFEYEQQITKMKNYTIQGYAVGTPYLERDQLLYAHQGEIITPRTFSDGIRNGDLVMGDNNKVVEAIKSLTEITTDQAREIQKMAEALNEFNNRELIKTARGAA